MSLSQLPCRHKCTLYETAGRQQIYKRRLTSLLATSVHRQDSLVPANMFKTLIYLATLSLALADGPFFTVQPKSDPNKCIDNRPLSGSDRSYASL